MCLTSSPSLIITKAYSISPIFPRSAGNVEAMSESSLKKALVHLKKIYSENNSILSEMQHGKLNSPARPSKKTVEAGRRQANKRRTKALDYELRVPDSIARSSWS